MMSEGNAVHSPPTSSLSFSRSPQKTPKRNKSKKQEKEEISNATEPIPLPVAKDQVPCPSRLLVWLNDKQGEETKKLEKLKQELRGREYTYDSNGEVIVISQVDPDKLPSQRFIISSASLFWC